MNIIKYLIIIILVANISMIVNAQPVDSATQWQVLDLEFTYKSKLEFPLELTFGAVFSHESGYSMTVPGFYNDGDQWVIRFCPPKTGLWNYQTYSSASKLAGKEGTLTIGSNTKLDEHGPIEISRADPQKFSYADGTPYFLLAFELDWLFALDVQNKVDIPRTKQIVSHLAENKFNQVVMNVYAYDANWGERQKINPKYNYAEPDVFPFGGTNANPDFSMLNIDFFKHLDRVIAHLDEKEIIAHLMIYVWNKKVNWPDPESKADNLYFDYVIKRYQAFPNLMWDISKEALAYGRDDIGYITRRIDRLRKLDGHARLLSVHDYSYCANFPEKVDFISIQNWRPNIYNVMADVKKRHPKKPILNIEHGGYEKSMHYIFNGAYENAEVCLDRNYKCIFAGTYSTYYWQHTSWYEVVYNPFSLPKENQPKFNYYKNIASLFQAFDFNSLEVAANISNTFCLTDHKTIYMFYVTAGMISLQGSFNELKGEKVKVKWFDPFTGLFHGNTIFEFGDGTWTTFPRHEDISSPFCLAVLEVI